ICRQGRRDMYSRLRARSSRFWIRTVDPFITAPTLRVPAARDMPRFARREGNLGSPNNVRHIAPKGHIALPTAAYRA
ncbi:MAG: hypothetical protein J5859_07115, partial [Clostridia bacterium]|nr:hypothetical protein [Clostridia bacterium]